MSQVTTHVLDAAAGRPKAGVPVRLEGPGIEATGVTDDDGRVRDLGPASLPHGTYRLTFEVATPFYPEVVITFAVSDDGHYHVPLLLSPYSYSTYRGS
ncbi:hydroxyisourate hydrolase [Nocardioides sp. YIM 152588]|uniref:hydroxyisourate hydrolase n=1 Tax=Nocardioides sp. YIM 152588 TaxID=3158259 RepID=UPI0032E4EF5C